MSKKKFHDYSITFPCPNSIAEISSLVDQKRNLQVIYLKNNVFTQNTLQSGSKVCI